MYVCVCMYVCMCVCFCCLLFCFLMAPLRKSATSGLWPATAGTAPAGERPTMRGTNGAHTEGQIKGGMTDHAAITAGDTRQVREHTQRSMRTRTHKTRACHRITCSCVSRPPRPSRAVGDTPSDKPRSCRSASEQGRLHVGVLCPMT